MALTVYTASYNTLSDLIASMDALLAPILSRTIVGAGFTGIDQVRTQGIEMSIYATIDSGGVASTNPYHVMAFASTTLESAAAQMNAFMVANAGYFFSPTFFIKLDTVRHTLRDVALLFYNTNYTDGINNWVPLGSSGAGGGGTITSAGLAAPAIFNVTGSPITTAGTFVMSLANQSANLVWAGPASGSPAAPTFRALVNDDLPPATPGLVYPTGLAFRPTTAGYYADYIPSLGQIYMTNQVSGGKLQYIDRSTDTPVDVAAFPGKTPANFVYSVPNSKFVIANQTTIFTCTAAGVVISPILAANMWSGMALNTQTGHIWGYSYGSGANAIYDMDPVSDTIPQSYIVPDGLYGIEGPYGVAYCPTNNSVYSMRLNGRMIRYDINGISFVNTWACFPGGSNVGAILYDPIEDLIYAVNQSGGPSLKVMTPFADTVAATYPFPPGYSSFSAPGGCSLCALGDYLYIATAINPTQPVGLTLIFHKPSATFIGALSTKVSFLLGRPMAGLASENVLYIGCGGSLSATTALIPFRAPELR